MRILLPITAGFFLSSDDVLQFAIPGDLSAFLHKQNALNLYVYFSIVRLVSCINESSRPWMPFFKDEMA